MAKDVSIVFRATDNFSSSVNLMKDKVVGLNKVLMDYKNLQAELFGKKIQVNFDVTQASGSVKSLSRDMKEFSNEANQAAKSTQTALEGTVKIAEEAHRAHSQLQQDMRNNTTPTTTNQNSTNNGTREDGNNGNPNNIGNKKTMGEIAKGLAGSDVGKMLGQAAGNAIGEVGSSFLGDSKGKAVGNVVGGAASGALSGFAVGGLAGAAIGAAIGGLTGVINNLTQDLKDKNEAFKSEVKSLYDSVKKEQEKSLTNGIQLASKSEQDRLEYSTRMGSGEKADKFIQEAEKFSTETPFDMKDIKELSKAMLDNKYKSEEILPMLRKIGDAGSALGISNEGQKALINVFGEMKTSKKVSAESINQLEGSNIPAIDYLAKALEKSSDQVKEMISQGTLDGEKASKIITDAMGENYKGSMEKESGTYGGLESNLNEKWSQVDESMGEGYTEERKKGMTKELEQLNGPIGEKMEEANKLIGQYQADLKNKYQQSIIDAVADAQGTEEYEKAQQEGNGAEMGRILAEARAKADIAYKSSEGYKLQQQSDLALVEGIQKDVALNDAYLEYGKKMREQFDIGYLGGGESALNSGPSKTKKDEVVEPEKPKLSGAATGLRRIPRNDYPLLLHEGERVLTRVEADKQDRRIGGFNITKLADSIVVREEADIDRIIEGLYSKFKKHAVNAGGVC